MTALVHVHVHHHHHHHHNTLATDICFLTTRERLLHVPTSFRVWLHLPAHYRVLCIQVLLQDPGSRAVLHGPAVASQLQSVISTASKSIYEFACIGE